LGEQHLGKVAAGVEAIRPAGRRGAYYNASPARQRAAQARRYRALGEQHLSKIAAGVEASSPAGQRWVGGMPTITAIATVDSARWSAWASSTRARSRRGGGSSARWAALAGASPRTRRRAAVGGIAR
jgi:hypothetical protein